MSDPEPLSAPPPENEGAVKFLAFELGGVRYALPLSSIREIVPAPGLTQVPGSPVGVAGVMLVAGSVITVIDPGRTGGGWVVLVQGREEVLGLLVSRVLGVRVVERGGIEEGGEAAVGGSAGEGLVPWGRGRTGEGEGGEVLLLLDPGGLLG